MKNIKYYEVSVKKKEFVETEILLSANFDSENLAKLGFHLAKEFYYNEISSKIEDAEYFSVEPFVASNQKNYYLLQYNNPNTLRSILDSKEYIIISLIEKNIKIVN